MISKLTYRAEMNHDCLHHPVTTHDAAVVIVPVVADKSLELELDDSSQRTFTMRPPRPVIDLLAAISTCTCHQLYVDAMDGPLVLTLRPWWVGGESSKRLLFPL